MTGASRSPDPRRAARSQVGQFLTAHRARVTPDEAGLPAGIGVRRVAGLRREEVALLAGISVEYYAKLERGAVGEVSPAVLHALTRVLRLDAVEADHLEALVRTAAGHEPAPRARAGDQVRPGLQRVLDLLEPAAAFVRNARLDVLATNVTGRALYAAVFDRVGAGPADPPNLARYLFCDPRSHESYADWAVLADEAVGTLRGQLGRSPNDAHLHRLVDDLTAASGEFRSRWEAQTVRRYRAGRQGFHAPGVGALDLDYEALDVVADPGLTLLIYSAAPESEDARRLAAVSARADDG